MSDYDRLSAQDATFVYAETASAPMHVGFFGVFEDSGVSEAELCRHLESRLHLFPRMRQKLAFVPYEQGYPVWVDDDQFDIREHVRVTTLCHDDADARKLTARMMTPPLPRSRPLWEVQLFAMTDKRVGLIFKIHHCLIDGVSGAHLITVLFDFQPRSVSTEPQAWRPVANPSPQALLRDTFRERATQLGQLRDKVLAWQPSQPQLGALFDRASAIASSIVEFAQATLASKRRATLAARVGPYLRYQTVSFTLDEVKEVKARAGCKINDVVLTMVATGVGDLLRGRGVPTYDSTVKAVVPVSRRTESSKVDYGNKVSMMALDLPVDSRPSAELLEDIGAEMQRLKHSGQSEGADVWLTMAEHTPPTIVSLISKAVGQQRLIDVVVTNVPGPPFPLYLLGGKMLEVYPFIPLFGATSLGVAVASYNGRLYFGLSGDWDATADLPVVVDGLRAGFEELQTSELDARAKLALAG